MAPKIVPFSFGDEAVMAGSAAQVTCLASEGDLPMDVQWHFRGSNVSSLGLGMSTTRVGSRTNLLVIDTVSPENGGLYTCRASNAAGLTDYSAELLVQGIGDALCIENPPTYHPEGTRRRRCAIAFIPFLVIEGKKH